MMKEAQNDNLSVRLAEAGDAELLWHWANDKSVRERSFNQEPIPWESHLEWFSRRLASPDTKFYLLLEDGEPVGQIRYDRDADGQAAEISFSIAKENRGRGFGIKVLRLTAERAARDLSCREIVGFVIEDNEASSKAFLRAGFTTEGTVEIHGRRAFRFVWLMPEN